MSTPHDKRTTATDARQAAVGLSLFACLGVAAIVLLATGHTAFGGVALWGALLFAIYGERGLRRYRQRR
jgi:hypothetical protein